MRLNGLDLFSGIGGISLAIRPWVQTVAYCEINHYCRLCLLSRMQGNDIDRGPIWDNVTTLQVPRSWQIDIISAGFPCQDISQAGTGKGLAGKRSGLFSEVLRLAEEIKPKFIFLENVAAIAARGLDFVGESLAEIGYDIRWDIISASEFGAWHERKRWFALAHLNCKGVRLKHGRTSGENREKKNISVNYGEKKSMAYTPGKPWFPWEQESPVCKRSSNLTWHDGWSIEPNVGRVVHGLSYRVDRIEALGNSVVPVQAQEAFKRLSGIK